jgi:hypothetical protein
VDVAAGSWALLLTSSHKLPPIVEVPCVRQVVFSGVYEPNAKAVLARWVGVL